MTYDPAYGKKWRVERARGLTRLVDAGPARAHILELLERGVTYRGIAAAARVSVQVVHNVGRGNQTRCARRLADRILAVDYDRIMDRPDDEGFVPAIGAIGWRHQDIAAHMRGCGTSSAMVAYQAGELITRRTYDAVVVAYDALSLTPGPSTRTCNRARKAGYLPPLAWEENIDDPRATPAAVDDEPDALDIDAVAVARALLGDPVPLTWPERGALVLRAQREGMPMNELARRTGWSGQTQARARAEARRLQQVAVIALLLLLHDDSAAAAA